MPNSENFHTFRGYQLENRKSGQLTSALEDYLEMVFRLCVKNNYARVGQLAEVLNVKPPSASKMVSKLASLGYVVYDRYEIIVLTDKGRELGAFLLKRHNCAERFLRLIGSVSPLSEAELIEHSLLPSTLDALDLFFAFFDQNPDIRKNFEEFRKRNAKQL
jgi:DtxR family Mn-dependent transcriptional regulator